MGISTPGIDSLYIETGPRELSHISDDAMEWVQSEIKSISFIQSNYIVNIFL